MSKEYSWRETIAQITKDVINRSKPTTFFIATVESTSPLKIKRDEKFILKEENILLTDAVKDVEKEVEIEWETENSSTHSHKINGKKKIVIKNGLKKGDTVLVLQNNGGQEFVILERVNSA